MRLATSCNLSVRVAARTRSLRKDICTRRAVGACMFGLCGPVLLQVRLRIAQVQSSPPTTPSVSAPFFFRFCGIHAKGQFVRWLEAMTHSKQHKPLGSLHSSPLILRGTGAGEGAWHSCYVSVRARLAPLVPPAVVCELEIERVFRGGHFR